MKKLTTGKFALRANISEEANNTIEIYQAKERAKGNKLTKEGALDHLLINWNERLKK